MSRRVANWIEGFIEYSQVFNCPQRYRRWAAIWTLGTVGKRSIAMSVRGNMLAPNLFVQLIGGPSTGKSQAVNAIKSVLSPATRFNYIPPSVTRAGLEDFMVGNLQTRKDPSGQALASNECIGLSEEMQGIIPDQDLGHLTLYNILYDLPNTHKAVTRSHGEIRLEAPYCSIFTGAQPAFLAHVLPEQAWGMGFMSRSIMVWGTSPPRRSMFEASVIDQKLKADLIHDLASIHDLYGWMQWTPEAKALYNEWWVNHGGLPIPSHQRLAMGYNGRRELHMVKLAMIHSLAESNELWVTDQHVAAAIAALLEAEKEMSHIFNEMAKAGSTMALEDIIDLVRQKTMRGEETSEAVLIDMLSRRFNANQVQPIITNLINSGAIVLSNNSNVQGLRKFKLGRHTTSQQQAPPTSP